MAKEHKVGSMYKIEGDSVTRNNPTCPKCGPGFFMAVHKDRKVCGKCHYTEKKSSDN